jgi:hypothetical protein
MQKRTRLAGLLSALALATLCCVSTLESSAEDKKPASDVDVKKADESAAAQAKLEKEFAEMMTNATLAGKWRLVRGDEIGPERTESYTLGEVKKLPDGKWVIQARIQYGEKDFAVPVKVDVKWAGDTPTIQVTNWGVPLLGVGPYTARVMIYGGFYSGVWFGKDVGGLMSGRVVQAKKKEAESSDE